RGVRLHVIALRRPEETVVQEAVGCLRAGVEYLPDLGEAAPRLALRHPGESVVQEATGRLRAEVEYLPELSEAAPRLALRVAHAALLLHRPAAYLHGLAEVIASPDFSRTNLRRSVLLAHRLVRLGAPALYVHFAHKPATLGRFAALLAGVPYALSAHAKDIWLTPPRELARKVRDAEVVLTCTAEGHSQLSELAAGRTPVALAYHGVEVAARRRGDAVRQGPPVVLSVGRLVEKKGHDVLLRAAALVHGRGVDFRLRIAGEGVEWARLQRLVHELGLTDRVAFLGPLSAAEVQVEYERADAFALACRELENGDRDGIPNVLLEAMAHALPVVATSCAGVLEAVDEGSALLAPQDDPEAVAAQLERLLLDVRLREQFGAAAQAQVRQRFDRAATLPAVIAALRAAGIVRLPADAPLDQRLRVVA
ncbi:MAG: glycosyltransferase, partial [Acidobacteriota bacterium]|nr:glycosyltransferase [Acidobacteriota bacterium]